MKIISLIITLFITPIIAAEFTIGSYNCGGLSDHYDYLRAAAMQKVMQERYIAEPAEMTLNDKAQKLALKILFTNDPLEKALAEQELKKSTFENINEKWREKVDQTLTSYKIRPVVIHDEKVQKMLTDHLQDLAPQSTNPLLDARSKMAKRIFANHVNFDILCLQEADYLNPSLFPENYTVLFSKGDHSKTGLAWNQERFELVKFHGELLGRALIVQLRDLETGKTVLVASGHLTGCNPFRIENADSSKGDAELQAIVDLFNTIDSDLKVIGMDSNVTSHHPRMNILKESGYKLDYENYLEPTCSNPHQVLDTRIDWIIIKSSDPTTIINVPVPSVGLNSIQTNISDHKPIASKIKY